MGAALLFQPVGDVNECVASEFVTFDSREDLSKGVRSAMS